MAYFKESKSFFKSKISLFSIAKSLPSRKDIATAAYFKAKASLTPSPTNKTFSYDLNFSIACILS